MATALKVLKNTAKAGNAIIGAGVYSAVLQHGKPYECKVIKIGNTTFDPWIDYIEFCKDLGENCHTPLIYNMHVDHSNDYYVATMEHLTADPIDFDDEEISRYALAESISKLILGTISEEEFEEEWEEYQFELFPWGFDTFFDLKNTIEKKTDCFTSEDEEEVPYEDTASYRKIDLHAANIMFRNNTVVITDPWCNCEVEDHPSMETYIDESEDKNITFQYKIEG
tara:strand:- start:32 stop:706 length:675 start_codon:yes stop_codon:yes gene_type:complete